MLVPCKSFGVQYNVASVTTYRLRVQEGSRREAAEVKI